MSYKWNVRVERHHYPWPEGLGHIKEEGMYVRVASYGQYLWLALHFSLNVDARFYKIIHSLSSWQVELPYVSNITYTNRKKYHER